MSTSQRGVRRRYNYNQVRIFMVSIILLAVAIICMVLLKPNSQPIIEMKVVTYLNATLADYSLAKIKKLKDLPEGLLWAVKDAGKDQIAYGYILWGECSGSFCNERLAQYREIYPRDVTWKYFGTTGSDLLFIAIEEGREPDPEFFQIESFEHSQNSWELTAKLLGH